MPIRSTPPADPSPPTAAATAAEPIPAAAEAPPGLAPVADLRSPELYLNRELSLLGFHARVFEQARDASLPLLERLRFLCIASSNLDEFFEVRVAGLKKQLELGTAHTPPDRISVPDLIGRIGDRVHELVAQQYDLLNRELLPALEAEGIRFLRRSRWTPAQRAWIRRYFEDQVAPILSPIRLDPAHPFPRVLNKALHFILHIDGVDAFGHEAKHAVIQAPRVLPRFIRIPPEVADTGGDDFVFLTSVIHAHVADLFPGLEVKGCYQFRVTRDSDLMVDEEEVEDLREALEGELTSRRFGEAVRLEIADDCPDAISQFLLDRFDLEAADLYRVHGPVNLARLIALPEQVSRPDLKFPVFVQGLPPGLSGQGTDMFELISRGDVLVHHPFQSFSAVLDFVRQAASDPDVLAIKQTLYRAGSESMLEDLLLEAALAGKEVTTVVELRARFDEEANISLADRLQEAGAHVVYGVVGYKTHAKMLMVVRREGDGLKRYVHLATGNYHAKTTRLYTDIGLFTCDPAMCEDVHKMFMQLTSLGQDTELEKLLQCPFTLFDTLIAKIEAEADSARAGLPARIIAKMNALVEPRVIEALYQASRAGVEIDLIVRGICCLRPGVPGVSDNIRVRSIVGRFLEHTRIFYFENGGERQVFCASADWMPRNLHKRVETCFPIESPALAEQLIEQGLLLYLRDNTQAWLMGEDGEYRRAQPGPGEPPVSAQQQLLTELADRIDRGDV